MARPATERRRAVQPLWTAFDQTLAPHIGEGLLLCVSGGGDSSALLEAVARWPGRAHGRVEVASVDHGLRREARAEAAAVIARARTLGFDGHEVTLAPGPHTSARHEAALREARYGRLIWLAGERELRALVTAHHQDDDAEGFLLDALGWGGGAQGAGMPAVSEREGVRVLRPFVGLARADLQLALSALPAPPALRDPEDAREAGRRARLRARAVPVLKGLDAGAPLRLADKAARRGEDEEALRAAASALVRADGVDRLVDGSGARALVRRALERALTEVAPGRDPRGSGRTLDRVLDALAAGRRGASFHLPGATAALEGTIVRLTPVRAKLP